MAPASSIKGAEIHGKAGNKQAGRDRENRNDLIVSQRIEKAILFLDVAD